MVSAPAGFGKTTCIVEWVNSLDLPLAWLSLDPSDDDPGRFFAYFIKALQRIDAALGQEIEGVLHSGQLPSGEGVIAALINDLLGLEGRFLLVLDDFHVIQDRFIFEVLERLIANLPRQMHLVLVTREDPPLPLAHLRANNQLTEIRARDLRFALDDTAHFLDKIMGLALSQEDIATLADKIEGWIAGLQLVGLSMRDRADPSRLVAALSGSHRFILSYLTEQVLDRQPEGIQRFLLQTSLLDKLNGDLCDAVTGRTDSRLLLERLYKANLFLIPLDDAQQWYRYHHLFADLLRNRQYTAHQDETTELHQRASHWYAQAGMASEAIRHALAAEDYPMALGLLEAHAMRMIMQGYAKTVHGWVQAMPAEWDSRSPKINLAFAWMHLLRGAYSEATPYLERLQAIFPQLGEAIPSLRAEWLVMQALILYMQGQAKESMGAVSQALAFAPEQDNHVRSLAYYTLASIHRLMGDYSGAVEAYQAAIERSRAVENPVAEMMSTAGFASMAFERGQLHLAFEIAAPVSARLEQAGSMPPVSAVVYGVLSEVYYQWHQIAEARRIARRALRLSTLGGYNSGMVFCRVLLSRLAQIEGDLETAAREIQEAANLIQMESPDYSRQEVIAQQVRVYLARSQPAAAHMVLQGQEFCFPRLPAGQRLSHSAGLVYNSSLHLLLYQARHKQDWFILESGIEAADHLIANARQSHHTVVALEALLLRAQMHAALGNEETRRADCISALKLAEPEGFIGVFVEQGPPVAEALANLSTMPDYIERILSVFPGAQPPYSMQADLPEPLTDRELDVLRLMAGGLKYKEIAAELFISLNTVRFHVKAIYGKLNVNNRAQAVEMARQHHIL